MNINDLDILIIYQLSEIQLGYLGQLEQNKKAKCIPHDSENC